MLKNSRIARRLDVLYLDSMHVQYDAPNNIYRYMNGDVLALDIGMAKPDVQPIRGPSMHDCLRIGRRHSWAFQLMAGWGVATRDCSVISYKIYCILYIKLYIYYM